MSHFKTTYLPDHPLFTCIAKHAAGVDDGFDVAEGVEVVGLAGGFVGEGVGVDIEFEGVAGGDFAVDQSGIALGGEEVAAVDAVAVKDSCVELRDSDFGTGLSQREGRVFAGAAAAEVLAADDEGVVAGVLAFGDKAHAAVGQAALIRRDADAGVHAEVLAFFGLAWVVGQVLGGDDLVGVEVVT